DRQHHPRRGHTVRAVRLREERRQVPDGRRADGRASGERRHGGVSGYETGQRGQRLVSAGSRRGRRRHQPQHPQAGHRGDGAGRGRGGHPRPGSRGRRGARHSVRELGHRRALRTWYRRHRTDAAGPRRHRPPRRRPRPQPRQVV
ncbi:MAG: Arsenate-mycothiol transferase, partial [uncultured Propionibacteriaceae bacterium]